VDKEWQISASWNSPGKKIFAAKTSLRDATTFAFDKMRSIIHLWQVQVRPADWAEVESNSDTLPAEISATYPFFQTKISAPPNPCGSRTRLTRSAKSIGSTG
jgi:hypothetical protein